ncbi:MAG: hypothetical protein ACI379_15555 [Nocardioides sp.]|uniref:hypothetical protein n=1 Tax=Nocardioides sp. TaxID=35761 RepID=UPI003F066380
MSGTDGARLLSPVIDGAAALERGEWVEGSLTAALASLDGIDAVVDLVADPLAGASAFVVEWALEHCQGFQDLLDELVGDSAAISAAATTWRGIGSCLDGVGEAYTDRVDVDLAGQVGLTPTAYRGAAVAARGHVAALAGAASGVAEGILLAGSVLGTVRAFVQAKLADVVGAAVSAFAKTVSTGGLLAPEAGTRLALKAAATLKECRDLVSALRTSLRVLGELISTVAKGMTAAGRSSKELFGESGGRDLVAQFVELGVQRSSGYDV